MSKIRIIKETQCNNVVYKIQKKLFFWWITESLSDIGWHGEMCGSYDITFDTFEEAEDYICKYYTLPKIEIVQEYGK